LYKTRRFGKHEYDYNLFIENLTDYTFDGNRTILGWI